MTTALATATRSPAADSAAVPAGAGPTLAEALERGWRDLASVGVATCPVCPGSMTLVEGSGVCDDCGSALR